MGLRPTHRDESASLGFIDPKRVKRDFRRSVMAILQQLLTETIKNAALSIAFEAQVHTERPRFPFRVNIYKHG
jgi:hypothetical protein